MTKSMSILGCGWLGLPLAEYLLLKGYGMKGSTTTTAKMEVLREKGIDPYLIDLTHHEIHKELESFLQCTTLVIAIPPGLRRKAPKEYLDQMQFLHSSITSSTIRHVIFISSTSVYPDTNGVVTEQSTEVPESVSGKTLLAVERMFLDEPVPRTTIIRMAGLVGPARHPGRFLAGRDVKNPGGKVNLVHLNDCIGVIHRLIEIDLGSGIWNCCSDGHPTRQEFYSKAADAIGLEPPRFENSGPPQFKVVSNAKIRQELSYQFQFSDPFDMI